MKKKSFNKKMN